VHLQVPFGRARDETGSSANTGEWPSWKGTRLGDQALSSDILSQSAAPSIGMRLDP
jgi:hypothetical protein